MKRLLGCLVACATLFAGHSAFALTECAYAVDKVYYGTAGQIYVVFVPSGTLSQTLYVDPGLASKDKYFSMLLTAKAGNRQVVVRYAGTGVACTGEHAELDGLWLL